MRDQDYDIPELPEEDRIGEKHSLLKHIEPDLTREEHQKTQTHHEINHSTHSKDTHSVHLTHHTTTHSNHEPVMDKKAQKHHEQNTISEKVLRITCIIAIILWFIAVLILSIITGDSPFLTFVGLSPLLLTIIISYVLVDRYHMESGFLMVFPFIFTGIFLVLGVAGLLRGMDYLTLCVVNIVLGLLFEAILVVQHTFVLNEHEENHEKEHKAKHEIKHEVVKEVIEEKTVEKIVEKKTEKPKVELEDDAGVDRFVASIEDKAKAINAVIGRVYSVRKGGTESMRKLIRIDPAHYNEFNLLKDKHSDKRKHAAARILWKIRKTLVLMQQKEVQVFDKQDLENTFKLEREPYGHDKILDVLIRNDSDPIKTYYEGALQFCESAMSDLGYDEKKGEADDKNEHKHFFESLKFN